MKVQIPTRISRRGFVSIYICFACIALIPMAGMAVDLTILYGVKAKLQTAVDAAAIGAGYKLQRTTDMTDPTQLAVVSSAAQRYFNANIPSGLFGATQVYYGSSPSANPATGVRTIYVHTEYKVPMLFMRVLHIPYSNVAAQATVNVRFTTMMIVVDRSGSVVNGGANGSIISALNQFVANQATSVFIDGRDIIGMVSFGGNWKLDYAPVTNFQTNTPSIGTAINNIPFDTSSGTNTAEGLYQAWYQLKKLESDRLAVNVVLTAHRRPAQRVHRLLHSHRRNILLELKSEERLHGGIRRFECEPMATAAIGSQFLGHSGLRTPCPWIEACSGCEMSRGCDQQRRLFL